MSEEKTKVVIVGGDGSGVRDALQSHGHIEVIEPEKTSTGKKTKARVLIAGTTALMGIDFIEHYMPKFQPHKRGRCLNCGEEKYHGNSFCCAECAKQYRKEKGSGK